MGLQHGPMRVTFILWAKNYRKVEQQSARQVSCGLQKWGERSAGWTVR